MTVIIRKRLSSPLRCRIQLRISPAYPEDGTATDAEVWDAFRQEFEAVFGSGTWRG